MPLTKAEIKKIRRKYKKAFEILEKYDETRQLPSQRKKIYLTLSVNTINKLKKLREKTGHPISRIIDNKF